jgi:hypothetical protein
MPFKWFKIKHIQLDRFSFRILYAYNHYPPLRLGRPGDLYIQGSSSSLWYKVGKEHPLWNDESFGWVRVPGDLGLDRHIHIKHPLRHFHLVASSVYPMWGGYIYGGIISFMESVQACITECFSGGSLDGEY